MGTNLITLSQLAHGRSGDKGNHANIAIIAYTQLGFEWIKQHLTSDVVAEYFAAMLPSRVERFEAANVLGLNFMLYDALGGGASRSLRSDTQGKSYALSLLQLQLPAPPGDMNQYTRPMVSV